MDEEVKKEEVTTDSHRHFTPESVKEKEVPKEEKKEIAKEEQPKKIDDKVVEEIKKDVDAEEEFNKLKAEAEEAKRLKDELALEKTSKTQIEDKLKSMQDGIIEAIMGKKKDEKEPTIADLDTEEKVFARLQKIGYKGFANELRELGKRDAEGIVRNVISYIAEAGTLNSTYPELKDPNGEFSKKVKLIEKEYGLSGTKGTMLAAKMVKLQDGGKEVAEKVAEVVEDAKKGIKEVKDASHVEVSKKGIPVKKVGKEMSSHQKEFVAKQGLDATKYQETLDMEKTEFGRKTYRRA